MKTLTNIGLTLEDIERLAFQYDLHHNADNGYDVALAGGEDPKALGFRAGETYCTVEYDPIKGYYWKHDNVVEDDQPELEEIDNFGPIWDHWTDKY